MEEIRQSNPILHIYLRQYEKNKCSYEEALLGALDEMIKECKRLINYLKELDTKKVLFTLATEELIDYYANECDYDISNKIIKVDYVQKCLINLGIYLLSNRQVIKDGSNK